MPAVGLDTTSDIAQKKSCAAVDPAELTAIRIACAAGDTRTSLFSPLAEAL